MKLTLGDYALSASEVEPLLVSGSVGVYQCDVKTDAASGTTWDGLAKTIVFRNGWTMVSVPWTGTTFDVPHEALANPGDLFVGAYGTDEDGAMGVRTKSWTEPVRSGVHDGKLHAGAEEESARWA